MKERVQLIADRELMDPAAPRSGRVEVKLRDGRTVSHFTRHARHEGKSDGYAERE